MGMSGKKNNFKFGTHCESVNLRKMIKTDKSRK